MKIAFNPRPVATLCPQLVQRMCVTSPLGSPPLKIAPGREVPKPQPSGSAARFEPRTTAPREDTLRADTRPLVAQSATTASAIEANADALESLTRTP